MRKHKIKIVAALIVLLCIIIGTIIITDYYDKQESIRKWEENLARKFQSNPSSAQVIGDMIE